MKSLRSSMVTHDPEQRSRSPEQRPRAVGPDPAHLLRGVPRRTCPGTSRPTATSSSATWPRRCRRCSPTARTSSCARSATSATRSPIPTSSARSTASSARRRCTAASTGRSTTGSTSSATRPSGSSASPPRAWPSASGCCRRSSNLAATAALEHFTATLAELVLSSEETRALFGHDEVRNLFLWHALEESEHKAVAFDVYRAVGGSERVRVLTMNLMRFGFVAGMAVQVVPVAARRPRHLPAGHACAAAGARFRRSPLVQRDLWEQLRDYNRPDFHPDDRDTTELVERWRAELFGDAGHAQRQARRRRRPLPEEPTDRGAPRRPDRRRRPVRHRRRPPPADRRARGPATRSSRPATPSAARGTCSATRASAPTRTCTPSATRSGRGRARRRSPTATRSCSTSTTPRPSRASTSRSASTTASCAADWSTDDARWTVTAERTDTGETVDAHLRLPVLVHRLLPLRPRLPARLRRAWTDFAGTDRPPAGLARPTSTSPAGGSSSSAAAPPRSRSSRRWPRRPRTSPCCSARRATSRRCRRATRPPSSCSGCCRSAGRAPVVRWMLALGTQALYQLSKRRPGLVKRMLRKGLERELPDGLRHRHPLHAALRPVGPAAVRRARRRPVRGHPLGRGVGRHRPHRHVHRDRPAARVGRRARGRRHRHRHRARAALPRRHRGVGRRRGGRPARAGWPTRG